MTNRPAPTPEALDAYARGFNRSATLRFFGVELDFPDERTVRCRLDVRDDHRGGLGSDAINGGILAAIFDLAIGCTAALVDPGRRSATVQLSMNFEQPVRGGKLVALGRIDRAGGSTAFSSATIEDERGVICARAQGVVRLSREPWAAGSHPGIN
jgi:uncharacterized protein (TIGR00369 family)